MNFTNLTDGRLVADPYRVRSVGIALSLDCEDQSGSVHAHGLRLECDSVLFPFSSGPLAIDRAQYTLLFSLHIPLHRHCQTGAFPPKTAAGRVLHQFSNFRNERRPFEVSLEFRCARDGLHYRTVNRARRTSNPLRLAWPVLEGIFVCSARFLPEPFDGDASGALDVTTRELAIARMKNHGVTPISWTTVAAELQREWSLPTGRTWGGCSTTTITATAF